MCYCKLVLKLHSLRQLGGSIVRCLRTNCVWSFSLHCNCTKRPTCLRAKWRFLWWGAFKITRNSNLYKRIAWAKFESFLKGSSELRSGTVITCLRNTRVYKNVCIGIVQDLSRRCGRTGTWRRKWERLKAGESNGKVPPSTCPWCSVPEPYRSHDWALVPANPASKAEY